ncbi:MAG: 3-phosphoshikimate 1-carboxyvinyltransferase [Bacteroidaceae bacterium]|nr:3-phosphoshikimate 1-carboxyvinyltransferase [Bacteroidaceae bacterium]
MANEYIDIKRSLAVRTEINLPASKSISNRALIINALSHSEMEPQNLSDCDDTRVMIAALRNMPEVIDIGAAGTAMRFLTAYLCVTPGVHTITGTERMRHRPIGILVNALRQLGADVQYEGEEGFPPLRIEGRNDLEGGNVVMAADVSSQFLSALLMIGPTLKCGLTLKLTGRIASRPYLEMTMQMMRTFGAKVEWESDDTICVEHGNYTPTPYVIENDWSAASYWYEVVSLTNDPGAWVELPGLPIDSLQGDSCVRLIFDELGVGTQECVCTSGQKGIRLYKQGKETDYLNCDFTDCPDLAQTIAVTCALKEIPYCLSGVESLRIKETDRLAAVRNELDVLGYRLKESDCCLEWGGFYSHDESETELPVIHTYEDHRMAMAFAPACCKRPQVRILNPAVVSKSYPSFWNDMEKAGFNVCS